METKCHYYIYDFKKAIGPSGESFTLFLGAKLKIFPTVEETEAYIDAHFPSSRIRRKLKLFDLAQHQIQEIECIKGAFSFKLLPKRLWMTLPIERVQQQKELTKIVQKLSSTLPKEIIVYQDEEHFITKEKVHQLQIPTPEGFYDDFYVY